MTTLAVWMMICAGIAAPASPGEAPVTHARQIEDESAAPSTNLVEKQRELRAQWTEYVEFLEQSSYDSDIWIYRNKTAPLDALLKDVFRQAIKESGSFDGAMKQLQDLVRWQQVPDELVMGGLQKEVRDSVVTVLPEPILPGLERDVLEDGPDDFVPIIVYLLPEGNVNPAVGFFVNAYPTKDSGKFCRVRTPPYALMLSDKEVHCADLTKQFTYAGSEPSAGGHNILMVDTFDTGDAYPSVALVDGPGGGGGYFMAHLVFFDADKGEWCGLGGPEFSDVSGWSYDQSTKILEVQWHLPEETRIDRVDMRELLKEGLDYRAKRESEKNRYEFGKQTRVSI